MKRRVGKFIGFVILVLAVIFVLQHRRIESWYLELTGSASVRLLQEESEASAALCIRDPSEIPAFSGQPYAELNDNIPSFSEYDLNHISGEHYSDPDMLGRCRSAAAMLERSMMPTAERGEIGMIRPTGWHQEKYPGIIESDPPYLYHRCHLIAYALTGQNANEKNLITGTQYMNMQGMRPFEVRVARYLDSSDHHVLYRVTPYFRENELLARGVEMEAYSVEDGGRDLCFHVFVYNVQPGIQLNYQTGENEAA